MSLSCQSEAGLELKSRPLFPRDPWSLYRGKPPKDNSGGCFAQIKKKRKNESYVGVSQGE